MHVHTAAMKGLALALLAALSGAALPAAARATADENSGALGPAHLGWLVQGSLEFGGDRVADVYYTNGESQTLRAGQGVGAAVGGHYRFAHSPFDLSASVGFKYVTSLARNADIHINRAVIDLQGTYWLNESTWVSAGPVVHTGGGFSGGGLAPDLNFDTSTGGSIRLGWRWVGFVYTNIRYTDQFGDRLDASSGGVQFIWRF